MRALAAAVLLQRRDDIGGLLMAKPGNGVVRIRVAVILEAMAAVAGVELLLALYRVARGVRAECPTQTQRRPKPHQRIQSRNHLILRAAGSNRALMLKSGGTNCHSARVLTKHPQNPAEKSGPSAWQPTGSG